MGYGPLYVGGRRRRGRMPSFFYLFLELKLESEWMKNNLVHMNGQEVLLQGFQSWAAMDGGAGE